MSKETRNLTLPADVYGRIEERLPYTEFDDIEAYITYVLEEVLTEVSDIDDAIAVDEEQVQDRLESLGYLNE